MATWHWSGFLPPLRPLCWCSVIDWWVNQINEGLAQKGGYGSHRILVSIPFDKLGWEQQSTMSQVEQFSGQASEKGSVTCLPKEFFPWLGSFRGSYWLGGSAAWECVGQRFKRGRGRVGKHCVKCTRGDCMVLNVEMDYCTVKLVRRLHMLDGLDGLWTNDGREGVPSSDGEGG